MKNFEIHKELYLSTDDLLFNNITNRLNLELNQFIRIPFIDELGLEFSTINDFNFMLKNYINENKK